MNSVEAGEVKSCHKDVQRRVLRRKTVWEDVLKGDRTVLSYLKLIGFMVKQREEKNKN